MRIPLEDMNQIYMTCGDDKHVILSLFSRQSYTLFSGSGSYKYILDEDYHWAVEGSTYRLDHIKIHETCKGEKKEEGLPCSKVVVSHALPRRWSLNVLSPAQ